MERKSVILLLILVLLITNFAFALPNYPLPDYNGDRKVNFKDFCAFANHWCEDNRPDGPPGPPGSCGDEDHPYPIGDIDQDCFVGINDLALICAFWLEGWWRQSGLEKVESLKDEYFNHPDHEWAKWMVVSFAPGQITEPQWKDSERQATLNKFDPDHIDEWGGQLFNRGDFARMRGIASNTPMENLWDSDWNNMNGHSTTFFTGNGIARKENGSICQPAAGSYNLCHQAPKWQEISIQASARMAIYGDSLFQDRFCGGVTDWPQYGWCDWCNKNFIDYMLENFSTYELDSMSFNPGTFHIRTHAAARRGAGLTAQQLLEDPILHEYIRFKYRSEMYLAVEAVDQYHETAAQAGYPIPAFYGNQGLASGERTYPVVMSPHTDIVWIEQSPMYQPCFPPIGWLPSDVHAFSTLQWKNGRAASHYRKAVVSLQSTPSHDYGTYKRYPVAITNAEATANGGVSCQTWKASFFLNDTIDEKLVASEAHHAKYVSKNRGLFVDRTSVVDHALVYSVPSLFWSYFSTLTLPIADRDHLIHFGAAARLLEDRHVPYNTLLLGHRDVYDDTEDLASLSNYKTLILAYADCIADYQADAIKKWTRAGGKLVLWANENVGTRNEELNSRATQVFDDLISSPGLGTVETISTSQANSYIGGGSGNTIAGKIVDTVSPVAETTAPSTVWINVWKHGAGPMTSIQMVNYDIDPDADTLTSTGSFTVKLREPAGVTFTNADYIDSDYSGTAPTTFTPLTITRNSGYVEVTVPSLDLFGIVVFSVTDELDARMEAGMARKWHERLKIALRCPGPNDADYATLLSDSKTLLDQIQGDVVVGNFTTLISQLQTKSSELESALNVVTVAVTSYQDTIETDARDVVASYKFDFGPIDSLESGWTEVTVNTAYTVPQGYGWTASGDMGTYDSAGSTIAYWQFDENGTNPVDAVGPYHLQLSPDLGSTGTRTTDVAVSTVPNPERGSFDSDDPAANSYAVDSLRAYAEYEGQFEFNDKPLTVEGWFKHAHPGIFQEYVCGTMGPSSGWLGWRLELLDWGGSPGRLRLDIQGTSYRNTAVITPTNYNYADNQWHHFAVTWEPNIDSSSTPDYIDGRIRMYVDGSLRASQYGIGKLGETNSRSFCIGVQTGGDGRYTDEPWTGKFDEFRVTRAALTPKYFLRYLSGDKKSLWEDENSSVMDAMNRDYIRSKDPANNIDVGASYPPAGNGAFPVSNPTANPATFRVDLPNGDYNVTVVTGNYDEFPLKLWGGPSNGNGRCGMTYVSANGVPVLYGDRIVPGYQQNRTFQTTVTGGYLELEFSGRNVGPMYDNTIEWMVNGLIIQPLVETITPEAQSYLSRAQLRSEAAIRDWYALGPFDDDDCLGLETIFGPEQSTDIADTYSGKGGSISWQLLSTLTGDAPYVSMSGIIGDVDEVAGFVLSHVYCPNTTPAVMVSSISQAGVIYVNGEAVYTDKLSAGLLPEEQKVNVTFKQGWNSILIKTLNHWGDEWSVWAGLLTTNEQPLADQPGIIVSAPGPQ